MLARLHELVGANSQLVIATHSPIIMAYPDALILAISSAGLERVAYEDTEHYTIAKAFLADRQRFLRQLLIA
jgi:predicted ATPase